MPRGGIRPGGGRPRGIIEAAPRLGTREWTARHKVAVRDMLERVLSPEAMEGVLLDCLTFAKRPEGFKDRELLLKYAAGVPSVSNDAPLLELTGDELSHLAEQVMDAVPAIQVKARKVEAEPA